MFNLIQQIKHYSQQSFFRFDKKLRNPLLDNSEILDLLHLVQNKKKSRQYKHDIAFQQTGDNRSVYRGIGMDYEESRRYQPGDDPRYMNWQLSARTGQYYMKVFREERQSGVFILIDRRYSMRFGTQQRLKITQAARTAAIAAFTAQENNFSVGGVILDNEVGWFRESQNKQAIFDFVNQTARPALPAFSKPLIEEPDIKDVLDLLNQILTAGSIIFLISDFHDLNENNQSILLQLSSAHQIHAIQITDPAEIQIPQAGNLSFKNVSSKNKYHIDTNSSSELKNYKSASEDYFSFKKSIFENIAIPYQQILTTDNDIEHVIKF